MIGVKTRRVAGKLGWRFGLKLAIAALAGSVIPGGSAQADGGLHLGGSLILPVKVYSYLKATRGSPLAPTEASFSQIVSAPQPSSAPASPAECSMALARPAAGDFSSLNLQLAFAF